MLEAGLDLGGKDALTATCLYGCGVCHGHGRGDRGACQSFIGVSQWE
jgi:hypothetical protein